MIKRYSMVCGFMTDSMEEDEEGGYVEYNDYKELEAELSRYKKAINDMTNRLTDKTEAIQKSMGDEEHE